jgi:hypothetical protein
MYSYSTMTLENILLNAPMNIIPSLIELHFSDCLLLSLQKDYNQMESNIQ